MKLYEFDFHKFLGDCKIGEESNECGWAFGSLQLDGKYNKNF